MKFKKVLRWGVAALFVATAITASVLFFNDGNKNTQDRLAKASVSIVETNKSAVKSEENNLNKKEKLQDILINQNNPSAESENENNANSAFNDNDIKENIIKNTQINSQVQNHINTNSSSDISVNFKKSASQGCSPLKVQFTNMCSNKNVSCIWNFGDGSSSYESNPSHEYQKGGKYKAQLTVKNNEGNVVSSEIQEIQVYNKPFADFEYKVENNCIAFLNTSKQSSFVQWKINDTIDFKEETNYCIKKSGKYLLSLTVENNFGCSDSSNKSVDLIYKLPVNFANAITPDGDGVNDVFGPIVADYNQYEFRMFIYNKEGKCIFEYCGSPVNWDGTDQGSKQLCPADIYFYKVIAVDKLGNKNEFSGKINLKR